MIKGKKTRNLMKYGEFVAFFAWAVSIMLTVSPIQIGYAAAEFEKEQAMGEVTINETNRGKSIEVHLNNRVILQLPENPSTGYRWELEPLDANILKLQVDAYREPPSMALGAKGSRIFEFLSQSTGTVNLRLQLRRPWESESATLEIFEVTLQILPSDAK
jgi:inhibitor of cysteine peptidase